MGDSIKRLPPLQMNAFAAKRSRGEPLAASAKAWALARSLPAARVNLRPDAAVSLRDWQNPEVGWGLIVPDDTTQLPEVIKQLLKARGGAPVFQYLTKSPYAFSVLRCEQHGMDLDIGASKIGSARGSIPLYLLILGGPAQIPWRLQYVLQTTRCVGRLDLSGTALENYVNALLRDFGDSTSDPYASLIWSTSYESDDITRLMRDHIAAPVHANIARDPDLQGRALFLDGAHSPVDATAGRLAAALADERPGLVVTTSHGATPAGNQGLLKATLGYLVDQNEQVVQPERLLSAWQPAGAIWYAHACASAGCDAPSAYKGLFEEGSANDQILRALTALGPQVAPFPTQALGAKQPLAAFVGHVEPTFDWTLKRPLNEQPTTHAYVQSLYPNLYRGDPVGLAFRDCYTRVGSLFSQHLAGLERYDDGADCLDELLYLQLAARDVQATIILGDPTVTLRVPRV